MRHKLNFTSAWVIRRLNNSGRIRKQPRMGLTSSLRPSSFFSRVRRRAFLTWRPQAPNFADIPEKKKQQHQPHNVRVQGDRCWATKPGGSLKIGVSLCFPQENQPPSFGHGSKLNHQGTAGVSPCFHLPGFHFGVALFLIRGHSEKHPNPS